MFYFLLIINYFKQMRKYSVIYLVLCLLCWISVTQQDRIFKVIDFLRKQGNISWEQELQDYENDSKKNIWSLTFSKQQIIKQFIVRENLKNYELIHFQSHQTELATLDLQNRNILRRLREQFTQIQMGRRFQEYSPLSLSRLGMGNLIHGSISLFPTNLHKKILQMFGGKRYQQVIQQQKLKLATKYLFSPLSVKSVPKPQNQQSQTRQQFTLYKYNTPYPNKNQLSNPNFSNTIFSKQTISNTPSLNMLLSPSKTFQLPTIDDKDDPKIKDQHSDVQCQSDLQDLETYDSDSQEVQLKMEKTQEDKDQPKEQIKDQNLTGQVSKDASQKAKESQQMNLNETKNISSQQNSQNCKKDSKKYSSQNLSSILTQKNSISQEPKQK